LTCQRLPHAKSAFPVWRMFVSTFYRPGKNDRYGRTNVETEAREPIKDNRLPWLVIEHSERRELADVLLRVVSAEDPYATVTDFTYADGKGLLCASDVVRAAAVSWRPGPMAP